MSEPEKSMRITAKCLLVLFLITAGLGACAPQSARRTYRVRRLIRYSRYRGKMNELPKQLSNVESQLIKEALEVEYFNPEPLHRGDALDAARVLADADVLEKRWVKRFLRRALYDPSVSRGAA